MFIDQKGGLAKDEKGKRSKPNPHDAAKLFVTSDRPVLNSFCSYIHTFPSCSALTALTLFPAPTNPFRAKTAQWTMSRDNYFPAASSCFSSPSPPRGTEINRVNDSYDCILATLDNLEREADSAFSKIKEGIEEVREAVKERRSLVIRGEVKDETYGLNIQPEGGSFRWFWFTDGSAGRLPEGDTVRYGCGGFFGWQHPLNFSIPSDPRCASMFECELEAVYNSFLVANEMANSQGGVPTSRSITIVLDNLETKQVLEVSVLEKEGNSCLESLLANNSRVRRMIHEIREMIKIYESVIFKWLRSHTSSMSFLARGNARADELAKLGLQKAFERVVDLEEDEQPI